MGAIEKRVYLRSYSEILYVWCFCGGIFRQNPRRYYICGWKLLKDMLADYDELLLLSSFICHRWETTSTYIIQTNSSHT